MASFPDNLSLEQKLSAFTDGELDGAQNLEMLDYLSAHPEAMDWVRDQKRLSLAARRVLDDSENKAPSALRNRIVTMPIGSPQSHRWSALGRLALAACLLIGVGIALGRFAMPQHEIVGLSPNSELVIPASIVAQASRVHADCSRLAEGLHSARYPTSQGALADDVQRDMHTDHPYPNLTPMGFHYVGAGPCGESLPETIHLLYRSGKPIYPQSISVFVQRYHGQFELKPGEVYNLAGPDSPFPMLSWRTDRVIYYLIADTPGLEARALTLIRTPPTTGE